MKPTKSPECSRCGHLRNEHHASQWDTRCKASGCDCNGFEVRNMKTTKTKQLQAALESWIQEHRLGPDSGITFYSQSEWKKRGERIGNGAALSLSFDGAALHEIINYPQNKHAIKLSEEFWKIAEDHGFRAEQGFSWSAHFYAEGRGNG